VGKSHLKKSFSSKKEGWDVKQIRCATCLKWLSQHSWEDLSEGDVVFCSKDCENVYLNAEEEDIVY
jgi:hypothetical protein